MLDRIDIHIEVPLVDYEELGGDRLGESSEVIRTKVGAARNIQQARFTNLEKLARTIADLVGSEEIHSVHLAEALQYRPKLTLS